MTSSRTAFVKLAQKRFYAIKRINEPKSKKEPPVGLFTRKSPVQELAATGISIDIPPQEDYTVKLDTACESSRISPVRANPYRMRRSLRRYPIPGSRERFPPRTASNTILVSISPCRVHAAPFPSSRFHCWTTSRCGDGWRLRLSALEGNPVAPNPATARSIRS